MIIADLGAKGLQIRSAYYKIRGCLYLAAPAVGHGCLPSDLLEHGLEMALGGETQQRRDIPQFLVGEPQQALGFRHLLLLDVPGEGNSGFLLEPGAEVGPGVPQFSGHLLRPDGGENILGDVLGAQAEKPILSRLGPLEPLHPLGVVDHHLLDQPLNGGGVGHELQLLDVQVGDEKGVLWIQPAPDGRPGGQCGGADAHIPHLTQSILGHAARRHPGRGGEQLPQSLRPAVLNVGGDQLLPGIALPHQLMGACVIGALHALAGMAGVYRLLVVLRLDIQPHPLHREGLAPQGCDQGGQQPRHAVGADDRCAAQCLSIAFPLLGWNGQQGQQLVQFLPVAPQRPGGAEDHPQPRLHRQEAVKLIGGSGDDPCLRARFQYSGDIWSRWIGVQGVDRVVVERFPAPIQPDAGRVCLGKTVAPCGQGL